MLNRSLIVIRCRQPFLDWLRQLPDPVEPEMSLEEINEDASAYLVPTIEDPDDLDDILQQGCESIFEDQLASWWTDEDAWPATRDFETFCEWFEVGLHSIVEDLVDGPLQEED